MDRNWKLGDDLVTSDNIMDAITFDELIMTLRCNVRKDEIGPYTLCKQLEEIIMARLEDAFDLLKINAIDIIELSGGKIDV